MRFSLAAAALASFSAAAAAPMLRLSNAAVVVQVAPGAISPVATSINACNGGDGSLSLLLSSSAAWVTAFLEPPQLNCFPIQFAVNPAGFARGSYTASVTVSDPHAVDAPQVVTVTLQVGIQPVAVDQYIAPGGTQDIPLPNPCPSLLSLNCGGDTATTQDGGQWLAVVTYGGGTLPFLSSYNIHIAPPASMAPGTYGGNVVATALGITENIPVTMLLTTLPIAVPSVAQLTLQLAQNGPAESYPFLAPIGFTNSGMGTLALQSVAASGEGIASAILDGQVFLTVDPASRPPGTYTDGSLTIACNAANCPLQIPITLQILPPGAPVANYQGVVDNATFLPDQNLAPGDVAILTGRQFSTQAPAFAQSYPLPTMLGGASVLVNGVYAPLYYTSAGQIAFQVPSSATDLSLFQVVCNSQPGNTVTASVAATAPQIVAITDTLYNRLDLTHPAHAGQTIIIWAIGLGATNPPVEDGAAAPAGPLAVAVQVPGVILGTTELTPAFAGLSPGSAGLYQLNVTIPNGTQPGNYRVLLGFGVYSVQIAIQ